ncbi:MAG: hypothetical protein JOZ57_02580, partial [Abitibacteriaceae bacterium]|nr:hypothetical protein [Abditibacteriaceae bacterium]
NPKPASNGHINGQVAAEPSLTPPHSLPSTPIAKQPPTAPPEIEAVVTDKPHPLINEVVPPATTAETETAEEPAVSSQDLTPLTGEAQAGAMAREMPDPPENATAEQESAASSAAPDLSGGKKKGRRIHNLDEFVELWGAVLTRIKRKIGVSAVAYLHDAWPVAMDDKEAVLEFKKEFHYAKACEAATRLPFEQVLNECMATPRRLRFQLAQAPVKPPPEPVKEEQPVDDDLEEDVLTLAQDMFAAEVVGRSGEG